MKSKKGQGLPLNTIIIAILVLIVLIVLIVIFTTQIDLTKKGLNQTSSQYTQNCKAPGLSRVCVPRGTCSGVDYGDKFNDCKTYETCCSG